MKGMTIISEALLAIGIIMVAIAFVLVGGNIISFQTEGLFSSTQNQLSEEVTGVINGLPSASGTFSTTYEPSIDTYTVTVQEHRSITAEVPGQETSSTSFLALRLENTRISSADKICITKRGNTVNFTEGSCSTGGLDSFCRNGRCVNGVCQPERGETCSNSGGDCVCPDDSEYGEASNICMPDYQAEDFIEGSDNDAPDSTEPIGCVKDEFVGTQETGERCSYNFECQASLTCSSTSESVDTRCCPEGETWNGDQCIESQVFDIVYVPVNYDSSDLGEYQSDADQFHSTFVSTSPFSTCSDPSLHAEKHVASDIGSECNIEASTSSGRWGVEYGPRGTWSGKWAQVRDCANEIYGGDGWDNLHAICKSGEYCSESGLGGKAAWIGTAASFTDQRSSSELSLDPARVGSHEIGHTLNLRHVEPTSSNSCDLSAGCDTSNPPSTPSPPNTPDDCETGQTPDYMLSYCQASDQYGPEAYDHLESSELDPFLGGSCS